MNEDTRKYRGFHIVDIGIGGFNIVKDNVVIDRVDSMREATEAIDYLKDCEVDKERLKEKRLRIYDKKHQFDIQ